MSKECGHPDSPFDCGRRPNEELVADAKVIAKFLGSINEADASELLGAIDWKAVEVTIENIKRKSKGP